MEIRDRGNGTQRTLPPTPVAESRVVKDVPTVADESSTPAVARWRRTFESLQERDFRVLWLGMLPGTFGMQMGFVTNGYLAYELTGSAAAVGFVEFGIGLPLLVFSLVGGVVADRFPKKRVLLATQSAVGIAGLLLAFLVISGLITIWQMTLVGALLGTAFAFNMPARQAFVAELVSPPRMTNAVALNNTGMNMARIVGPALAGVLIGIPFIGISGVYIIMAALYGIVVVFLYQLPDRPAALVSGRSTGFQQLFDGIRYIWRHATLRGLMVLAFAPVLLGMSYMPLMPVFAEEVFSVGATGLGVLMMMNGVGALIGSLGIATYSDFNRRGLLQLLLGIIFGVALAIFAFSQSISIGLIVLPVVGGASAAYMALNMSIVMDYADRSYLGRVMSVNMITFSLMPLSVVPTGALIDIFGPPLVIGISGLCLVGVMILYLVVHPTHRRVA